LGGSQDLEIPSQDLEIPSQDLEIPSTLVEVQSPPPPEYTSTVPVSNTVVAMPSTTPTRDPKLFKTQFSESVEDVQSDIDVLRDLFTNSDSLGLTPDTVSSVSIIIYSSFVYFHKLWFVNI